MSEHLDPLARQLGEALRRLGLSITVAESCTGGWIAKVITDIPGSSGWFDRGFVTYSNAAKHQMLGVRLETLDSYGAVSEQVVREMVSGVLERADARVALAVSGIAGPGGAAPDKPVGTVWFAWSLPDRPVETKLLRFAGNRDEVRHQSVRVALERLLERLGESAVV
jgi:nicotinamide-nucleotide amidase